MDILAIDLKYVRFAYVGLAGIFTLCAIITAYLHHVYLATAFIVLAGALMFGGAMLISYLYKIKKAMDIDNE